MQINAFNKVNNKFQECWNYRWIFKRAEKVFKDGAIPNDFHVKKHNDERDKKSLFLCLIYIFFNSICSWKLHRKFLRFINPKMNFLWMNCEKIKQIILDRENNHQSVNIDYCLKMTINRKKIWKMMIKKILSKCFMTDLPVCPITTHSSSLLSCF